MSVEVVRYSSNIVKENVDKESERLFAPHREGRPSNWSCDRRTKDMIVGAGWLGEELQRMGLDDIGIKIQGAQFNRRVRSEEDMWGVIAQILNDTLDGKIDRNRRPHRRWG